MMKNNNYKDFFIGNLFCIKSTSSGIDKNKLTNFNGKIPYITRSDKNNGIDQFIGIQNAKYSLDSSNVITIGLDTQTIFYQRFKFYTGQNIQIIRFEELNPHTALYVSSLLKVQMEKFNWGGNGATLERLNRTKIMLPKGFEGKPDYDYMESYIKDLMDKKEKKYTEYIYNRLNELKETEKPVSLGSKKWDSFYLSSLFSFSKGDQNNMSSTKIGDIPLVSAKKNDNAYKRFVSYNSKKFYTKNSLTLNNDGDGGAGLSFYQPCDYLLDNHVTALYSKSSLSRYTLLFISMCITLQKDKFGHGYAINNKRLNVFQIMLPIDEHGNPDYMYMENYMKYLEYKKLYTYLKFKKLI